VSGDVTHVCALPDRLTAALCQEHHCRVCGWAWRLNPTVRRWYRVVTW
jgi:hypothetical protein